jgi:hypothetical protein
MACDYPDVARSHGRHLCRARQVAAGRSGHDTGMHAATRRPADSWPAALLPGALLVAVLTAGAVGSTGAASAQQTPVTDLHVVGAR